MDPALKPLFGCPKCGSGGQRVASLERPSDTTLWFHLVCFPTCGGKWTLTVVSLPSIIDDLLAKEWRTLLEAAS